MTNSIIWIASNWFLLLFAVAVCTTIVKARRVDTHRFSSVAYIAWGELLLYSVGIWFIYTGIGHAYFQDFTAPRIGWQPSPFQFELGWMEIPLGFVAILALWRGYEFRLAATIIAATFSLACAAQHIAQMVCCGNYAPNNAGPILWFADIFIPLLLVCLMALSSARQTAPTSGAA
jgi:hypothetical protein